MRFLVLAGVLLVAGCGGEATKPAAVRTATATPPPVPTATPTPPQAGDARAQERLLSWLQDETYARGRQCSPAGKLPGKAIAAMDCEYDGMSDGAYLLFKTRAGMRAYFDRKRVGRPIDKTECSYRDWYRAKRRQGRLAFVRVGAGKVVVWTDDSERIVGIIEAGRHPPARSSDSDA